jgi:hypothetical protein
MLAADADANKLGTEQAIKQMQDKARTSKSAIAQKLKSAE